jgi:hypothetical protein
MLCLMDNLALTGAVSGSIAAVGAVVAAIGAWRTEVTARWQARAERMRNDQARKENELHRMRHEQLYKWWHDMPSGPERRLAMRWFGEWTGARDPYRGTEDGAIPPGFGSAGPDDAYQRYVDFLALTFHPGQPGPEPRAIRPPDAPRGEPPELPEPPDNGWYIGSTAQLQPGDPVPGGMTLTTDPAAALASAWRAADIPHVYQADAETRTIVSAVPVTGTVASRALDLTEAVHPVATLHAPTRPLMPASRSETEHAVREEMTAGEPAES